VSLKRYQDRLAGARRRYRGVDIDGRRGPGNGSSRHRKTDCVPDGRGNHGNDDGVVAVATSPAGARRSFNGRVK